MPHSYIEIIGFLGAGLMVVTLGMRTMIPLRIVGIASSAVQIIFALLAGIMPMLVQHSILLPMNIYRLYQQLRLIRRLKEAAVGDLNMSALIPHMSHRNISTGEIVFRKGDTADEMFIVESGRLRLLEIDIDVLPGAVVGELGLLSPNQQRTQTLECMEDGELMYIGYDRIRSLFFEDPRFGFYFLRLTSARLFENLGRLEQLLEERDAEIALLRQAARHTSATLQEASAKN